MKMRLLGWPKALNGSKRVLAGLTGWLDAKIRAYAVTLASWTVPEVTVTR